MKNSHINMSIIIQYHFCPTFIPTMCRKKRRKKTNIASKIKNIMSKMRLTLGLTEDGIKDVDNISINRKLTLYNMFL